MGWVFWMWLPLAGFRPMMILTMQAVSLLYQFWIHTELVRSLGPLEWVLNTPSHHRLHHGSNPRYIDRDHAGTLIVWGRLFGTFEPENEADAPRFGLTKNIAHLQSGAHCIPRMGGHVARRSAGAGMAQ
jgi:sterol desaturase/sphingolipid hydroxylase (fatty acid hydroxylase superfamily)